MPGSTDTPARTSQLLPRDLDTDSDEDHSLTAEELIQREAQPLEERAAARAPTHHTADTERSQEWHSTRRWRAPSPLRVFTCQTPTRAPSRAYREQSRPGTFILDIPERHSRLRRARAPPQRPDAPPPAPDPPTGTMADPCQARLPPPKVSKLPIFSGE